MNVPLLHEPDNILVADHEIFFFLSLLVRKRSKYPWSSAPESWIRRVELVCKIIGAKGAAQSCEGRSSSFMRIVFIHNPQCYLSDFFSIMQA